MERRVSPRTRRRIPCLVRTAEREYRGMVLDLSSRGLFVQLTATLPLNARIEVELRLPGVDEPVTMSARVARKRVVPAQLQSIAQGGVGLRLPNPPKVYSDFIAAHEPGAREGRAAG